MNEHEYEQGNNKISKSEVDNLGGGQAQHCWYSKAEKGSKHPQDYGCICNTNTHMIGEAYLASPLLSLFRYASPW